MFSLFLPVAGEEVHVVVASHNSTTSPSGEWIFSVRLVAGEVVSVKRDPNSTRGFKVRVRLQEKSGVKTEVAVGASAVVRAEYASELGESELKALLAGGHVPIVAEKRAWKKCKERGTVGVLPQSDSFVAPTVAGEPPAQEKEQEQQQKKKQSAQNEGSGKKTVAQTPSRAWKRLLEKETPDVTVLYDLREVLGKGNYGTTRIAVDIKTKRRYACKSISKRKLTCKEDVDDVKREIELLHHLGGHPNVIGFKGAFEDRVKIHLIMELCTGGELFDSIVARGQYSEQDAARVVRSMLRVVTHCHALGVIHRDLKPENFLLADRSDVPELKAIDFGLSVYFKEGQRLSELAGSAFYIAPEVLKKNYAKECDIWSCGVILYILLSGMPPFFGDTEAQIFESVMNVGKTQTEQDMHFLVKKGVSNLPAITQLFVEQDELDLQSEPWSGISDAAKDVVRKLLVRDPDARATADDILQHEWMKENGVASDKPLGNTVMERLKKFAAMNKLKKEALLVIAKNLPKEEIEGLHQVFKSMDLEDTGVVSVDTLRKGLQSKGELIPDEDLAHLLANVDVDGNGLIDYEEFLAATLHTFKLENDEQLIKAFEHFDTDGSGTISRDELREALKKYGESEENISTLLEEVDKDGDGQIDYEEFRLMMLGK